MVNYILSYSLIYVHSCDSYTNNLNLFSIYNSILLFSLVTFKKNIIINIKIKFVCNFCIVQFIMKLFLFVLCWFFQKEIQAHKSATKGGAFRLNMHPTAYFDRNPYSSDKVRGRSGSATLPSKKDDVKPFKPSSPGKHVSSY